MKKIYLIAVLFFFLLSANGYSQRIWGNPIGQYAYNPAGGAMSDVSELTTCYYNTYTSAYNNPMGILLQGSASFPNDKIAAGFRLTSESGGVLKSTKGEATFIYRLPVWKNSKLAFGISAVCNQLGIIRDRVNAQHPDDPILQGAQAGFWADANFGVSMYESNKYYFGLGIYNLLGGKTSWLVSDFTNRGARLYSLSGMYTFNVFQGDGRLEMSGVGMSYLSKGSTALNFDISSRIIMKKSFWVGCGYAPNTVKVLCGTYFQNFAVGYSGGIGMGEITKYTYSFPRHELFLKIELNNSKTSRALIK